MLGSLIANHEKSKLLAAAINAPKNKDKNIDIINLEKELSEITGLGVNIDFDSLKKTGTIKLQCKNLAEFNFIIKKIKT